MGDFFKEVFFFLFGVILEGPKKRKEDLKGWLFVVPFCLAFIIMLYLVVRVIV